MLLKTKIIIIFGILFVSFGLTQLAINRFFILPSFINLENDEAIRNLNRVSEAIKKEVRHLDDTCHDWGAWDDSYDFMVTDSQEYKDSSLSVGSFVTANLNLIYYLNEADEIFWGKIYDLETENEIKIKGFNAEDFSDISAVLKLNYDSSDSLENIYRRGVVLTERGPMMLAARPILTSDNAGPPHGTLVMGRLLTESILKKIKDETRANFVIHVNNAELPQTYKNIFEKITPSNQFYIEKENPDKIFMYESFPSLQAEPAFLTEVIFPREITRHGLKAIKYSLVFLVVVGFILLSAVLMLIKNLIIKPVIELSRHVKQVEKGNYEIRAGMTGKGAIVELANSFDKMIAKIGSQTRQLEMLSSLDGLTGINNRRIFDETLTQEWKRTNRQKESHLSAIMCDVDYFKLYNDNYGHQMGDDCLKIIAETIKEVLKRPSDFVARYGGEEFVVLLPNTSPEGAQKIAEDIRQKVYNLKIKHDKSLIDEYLTLSLGVSSIIPNIDGTPVELIKTADEALYESKEKGRNRIFFKPCKQR